jgi:hypothetical protein
MSALVRMELNNMVLAPVFERQNISLVTEQRLCSALTSFGLWPRSRCLVTKEILKPFENYCQYHIDLIFHTY